MRGVPIPELQVGHAQLAVGLPVVRGRFQPRLQLLDQTIGRCAGQFDRCKPGLVAFARREDALKFVGRHGGRLARLSELDPSRAH